MTQTDRTLLVKLNLDAGADADIEELEQLTQQLKRHLLELEVGAVELNRIGEETQGTKVGEPISWGTLLITSAAAGGVLTTAINTILFWLTRHDRCSITVEINGDQIQLVGVSSQERQKLIETWLDRHTGRILVTNNQANEQK